LNAAFPCWSCLSYFKRGLSLLFSEHLAIHWLNGILFSSMFINHNWKLAYSLQTETEILKLPENGSRNHCFRLYFV
jgi:hypothetical protein